MSPLFLTVLARRSPLSSGAAHSERQYMTRALCTRHPRRPLRSRPQAAASVRKANSNANVIWTTTQFGSASDAAGTVGSIAPAPAPASADTCAAVGTSKPLNTPTDLNTTHTETLGGPPLADEVATIDVHLRRTD
ncbi:unnamed protein product [Tilletia controversa]|uniref:Uncharacterized protein n=1 Tax=Tilletia caries TaxID=13290 RepID=A0A8T8T6J9_9BASI|nr:hypothetical protein A4X03_0g5356 [Tilletia caries]CAD6977793.1 unnamed protein product [Tilletia controversa]CAD7065068.1 unnamed protein product [Tilletia caries]